MNLQGVTHSHTFSLPDGPNIQWHEWQNKSQDRNKYKDTEQIYACARTAALGLTKGTFKFVSSNEQK